mmetsp:Transcript_41758/g.81627  ORF Transcript_41758/g.81627 Transcript_41758/m.81627 type:complete len:427 (-) Transcript_41758:79-1359(-)|eukprot:CAMPEP_0173382452 /NCGR_PEP_ID=MMETSP1356-20130122/4951_1 /TAXON_ID=77927 ORGANISM="Hemiselmis virescens, Strain PCC157" /NCGR_SAMPLE_ID=MMETSP1356 /ASSEMBLY_ACC=CAM_ASM_000847 /LENGTH=426 /DNA_ID=CAMNT_0014336795 /DNA_START=13 /DNA_END=1293 /DNA_ORIENTATION=-
MASRGYGSVDDGASAQRPGMSQTRILPATAALAACAGAAVLLVGTAGLRASPSTAPSAVELQSQKLYSIPNFVYQRTQVHFPEAEENWLNMAAAGKIGDDVKPEKTLNKLNSIISEARTHGLTENYEARVKAKTLAMEENYDEYDVGKGKVKNKFYGGKQVGGSTTLKPTTTAAGATLKSSPGQLAQLAEQSPSTAATTTASVMAAARRGAQQVERKVEGLRQRVATTLSAAPTVAAQDARDAEKNIENLKAQAEEKMIEAASIFSAAPAAGALLKVQVPAGLKPGQKFIANTSTGGSMLVTVPAGVKAGDWVAVTPPAAPNTHPGADAAVEAAIAAHTAPAPGGGQVAVEESIAEHNQALIAQQKRVVAARGGAQLAAGGGRMSQLRQVTSTRKGAGHPFASAMFDESISDHYQSQPRTTFGLEK